MVGELRPGGRPPAGTAGQSGSTVDEDFPGLAALVDPSGRVVVRLPDWREATLTVEIPL
jgi:predicted amidohydrolase